MKPTKAELEVVQKEQKQFIHELKEEIAVLRRDVRDATDKAKAQTEASTNYRQALQRAKWCIESLVEIHHPTESLTDSSFLRHEFISSPEDKPLQFRILDLLHKMVGEPL